MAAPGHKKKGYRRGLPILGLVFAVSLAAFAYGIAGPVVGVLEGLDPSIETQFDEFRDEFKSSEDIHGGHIVEIVFAGLLWFVLMGVSMLVVSVALGKSTEKEVWEGMAPSPANKKAMAKQLKKDLADAKRRAKAKQRKK